MEGKELMMPGAELPEKEAKKEKNVIEMGEGKEEEIEGAENPDQLIEEAKGEIERKMKDLEENEQLDQAA